jgi:hypothetical protein
MISFFTRCKPSFRHNRLAAHQGPNPGSETIRMSEAVSAVEPRSAPKATLPDAPQKRVTELRVSAHLMTLETGLFCVFRPPGSPVASDESGLPGVRISPAPGKAGNAGAIAISTFRPDGWLSGHDAAALISVSEGPAEILVTVYQSASQRAETAPKLQVLRLSGDAAPRQPMPAPEPARVNGQHAPPAMVAHMQRAGDVGGSFGEWLGERGSKLWIEGIAINPPEGVAPEDIEYQAVLGRGWNSPWVDGGTFCGSRGMALPLLGLRMRLKGKAAETHTLSYAATFVDGAQVGPVEAGEACEAPSLAALEALQVTIVPRAAADAEPVTPRPRTPAAKRSR